MNQRNPVHDSSICLSAPDADLFSVREMGRFLLIVGAVIFLIGLVFWSGFAPKWLGRLPGDIRVERGNAVFYFPIVTCIVISILLSLIMSIFRR
jgi:thiamine transporter ThiT